MKLKSKAFIRGLEALGKRTYSVEEIAEILQIGKASAYRLVKEGHFKIVRIGTTIRISRSSFDEWLDKLTD